MTNTNKGFLSLYISLLAVLILFNGCEDPGSVGSEFVDRPELTYDTLTISNTQVLNYKGYSGRLSFLPMGYYSDPIFGDVTARALVKPSRVPAIPDSVELGDNFSLQLDFQIDSLQTYGDTLSSTGFTLYEITSPWRGRALRMDDEIQYGNQVGSFTVEAGQNNILVNNLSETWVDIYRCYLNNCNEETDIDSLYNYNFRGLIAIPDQSSSKLTFSQVNETRFIIINEEGTDTVAVPLRDWGYTFDRVGETTIANTFPLHTTLEGMLSITMPTSILKDKNDNKNIIRADLVFYEAEEILTSSLSANPTHQRLRVQTLNLGLVAEDDPVYEYQFGEVPFFGNKLEEEASYQINVTNYVNNVLFGDETRQELILGIGSSTGALRSTLLFNETAPEQFRPKIIITSLAD